MILKQIGDLILAEGILDSAAAQRLPHRTEGRVNAQKARPQARRGGWQMTAGTRLQPKQPTGWFAAGREVARPLELLSAKPRRSVG